MDSLNLEKPDDVGNWLEDRPTEWAQVVAARVALRVFPILLGAGGLSKETLEQSLQHELILRGFQCVFLSWVSCSYSVRDPGLFSQTARSAASAAADAGIEASELSSNVRPASGAVLSAANAAAATEAVNTLAIAAEKGIETKPVDLHTRSAAVAIEAALKAVADIEGGQHLLSATVVADCQRLLESLKPDELIRQPLWPENLRDDDSPSNQPAWLVRAFETFANSEWSGTVACRLISQWYQALVPIEGDVSNSAFGEEADLAIASQSAEFWTATDDRNTGAIWEELEVLSQGGTLEPRRKQADDDPQDDETDPGGTPDDPETDPKDDKEPPAEINVAVQFDQFARKDELGRKRFAEILAARIGELHVGGGPDGLAVNLHAPWGAGKTTVLYFMKGFLEAEELPEDKRWVVIDFNAWQHEHRRPPWWPFLETVKSQLSDRLTAQKRRTRAAEVRHAWNEWKFKAEAFPVFVVLLVVAILLTLFLSGSSDVFKTVLGAVGGVFTLLATVSLYSRKAFFGSEKSASLYHDFASDPLEKLSVLFRDMIEAADAPVCIFIDDLDRCQNDFVVEFLEGLQTSFRHRKVAYVVAADKFWIKTSFEDKYSSFCEKTADRTQPLGYQFLEKIFQFNVPLPGMAAWKKRYLEARLGLMGTGSGGTGAGDLSFAGTGTGTRNGTGTGLGTGDAALPDEKVEDLEVERLRGEIRSTQPEGLTHETVRMLSTGDGSANPAFQAALALEYTTSAAAQREAEHFLLQYLELLPDNPRVIKRIINAFGMSVATAILEQQALDYDVLTRWTILEQCYPAVADELTGDPGLADQLLAVDADGGEDLTNLTDTLVAFCAKNMAVKLLKSGEVAVLTPQVIRRLTRGFTGDEADAA